MFSASALQSQLESTLPPDASGRLCIALSGGLDSMVLLHALAELQGRYQLRVVHVDHGLHVDSAQWADGCAKTAQSLGVHFTMAKVTVPRNSRRGLEAAARAERYAALKAALQAREVLLTAQHADDQLETVLLALVRGAGVNGLSGMPACQAFGSGWHVRPLLPFTRAQLEAWAMQHKLGWVEDPSNADSRLNRNYLRHEVIPALRRRWPDVANSVVRSASHLGEAQGLLGAVASVELQQAAAGSCLKVEVLSQLDGARRRNVLRYWLRSLGARAPSTHKLAALEHDMLHAQDDRVPCVAWEGFEVRRHRGLLYGNAPLLPFEPDAALAWDLRGPFTLPAGLGVLHAESTRGTGLALSKTAEALRIGFRRGGETLQLAGHAHRRDLKKLLQEEGILPWWRDRVPLLFVGRKVAAVGDLWVSEQFAARGDESGVRIAWEARPAIHAVR